MESAEFGDLPNDTFSLKALNLAKGTPVLIDGYQTKQWDGEALTGQSPLSSVRTATASMRWKYLVSAAALALIGLVLVARKPLSRWRAARAGHDTLIGNAVNPAGSNSGADR